MPYKDPEKRKALQRDWYQRNRERVVQNTRERRAELRDRVRKYKVDHGCTRCGYSRCAGALDIHHPHGKDHVNDKISRWVHRCMAWDKIFTMLEACEVICANCHREEHYSRLW